ncbi:BRASSINOSTEROID INSENSITIVE 1-associated receptor kinase 1 precursor, putative [Ricinus communis]|uniref:BRASSINOSTEROID INSENSITIVE 1-associated receptor kinase 1, putative n=1 Tax=Ricinus communis TaxID=3988 RepID=B9RQ82_RICCO|nr:BRASSINOSTEROID INSENSITIVE 1-associated receptor kinase 1 precursor, putative [Ricinus communis]
MTGNKMLWDFLFRFIPVLFLTAVYAQDQSGFISIDCGLPANSSYTDETTSLNYISDASFIDVGIITTITPKVTTNSTDRQQLSVRSFPEGDRNCFNVELAKNTKYLIRAIFAHGDYDGSNELPEFDLHLGPNKWVTVKILNASIPVIKEIIHTPTLNYIHICLVNTDSGMPFISALELRPLKNTTYVAQSGALVKSTRLDLGSLTNKTVRYPDDVFDRIWTPDHFHKWTDLSTPDTVDAQNHIDFQPPSVVMRTANMPTNASENMEFYIDIDDTTSLFYVYMHFAEIVELQANQSRLFNISLNGTIWYGPVIPNHLSSGTVYSQFPIIGGNNMFSLFKIEGSTLPPLLNAIEIYFVVDLSQSETDQDDVDAIMKIKSTYGITKNWQGDPCAPQAYVWHGLNCSYSDDDPPTVKSLNLSSSGLRGEIVSEIANLRSLELLDLSNNSLSGSLPDFLSRMTSLKVLNLTGNKLTGTIPADLFERSQQGSLLLSVSGNPELCPSVSCTKKKKSVVVPVVASVVAFFILAAALVVILRYFFVRSQAKTNEAKISYETNDEPLVESKKRQFSYSEILKITNNFDKILGKGGFGTVYHGTLNDGTQVAVKVLSLSSAQGYKEFQAEVKLLLRVHHRNLTTLVGYCNEGTNLGLIYEYMANGNLEDYLSDSCLNTLSWEIRLRIATEAAQGLEYLHNGCKPQIVHRDVKTTNILLNDKFQAKLADFGLSRIFPVDGSTHISTVVAGTPGYLDPEYYVNNWLTDKSDVFSFGVVLLEIITGRPAIAQTRERTHISQWVSSMLEKGDIHGIVDPRLNGDFEINSVWKAAELAMGCVSASSARRPTMNQAVVELNDCLNIEMGRTREGQSSQSFNSNSIELMTVNVHTEASPLAR